MLKVEGVINYPGYEYYLIDNSLNNFIKLNEGFELNIASGTKERVYTLIIGTESFIEKFKDDFTPKQFALTQNYPNPFNPSTLISYQLPASSHVTLKLFNQLGEEVETLVNEYQQAGSYSTLYIVNSTLASGVYFYTLHAGNFTETRKMILLK